MKWASGGAKPRREAEQQQSRDAFLEEPHNEERNRRGAGAVADDAGARRSLLVGDQGQRLRVRVGDAADRHADGQDRTRRHRDADRGLTEFRAPLPRSGGRFVRGRGDGARLCLELRLLQRDQPRLCQALSRKFPVAQLRAGVGLADGVRHRDRDDGGGVGRRGGCILGSFWGPFGTSPHANASN